MDLSLLKPAVALVGLTFLVWCLMYARRLPFMARAGVAPDSVATRARAAELLAPVAAPADNFANLLELPVLFYLLVVVAVLTGNTGPGLTAAAWSFVGLRALHSLIHCTVNRVAWRFLAYAAGALVLWGMWAVLAFSLFG